MKKLILMLSVVLLSSCVQQVTKSSKTIEGCDYSAVIVNGTREIVHRGDCKGCAEQREEMIKQIVERSKYGGF